jgi:molecular chaperone GrpE
VALAPVSDADAQQEIKKLRNDVLEARQALRQREAELEVSQQMGRDTLGKLKDQHERTLRAIADLDNYKKRAVKERDEATKFGQEKLLRDFLPVVDNLERALEHAKSPSDFEGLKQGVAMTRKLFEDTLGRHAVKAFSALDQMFDPHRHEAIQTIESDAPPGTVVLEVVRGFTLHDRLMRPAMVGVAKARAGSEPSPAEPKDDAATPAAPAPAPAPEPGAEPASPTESLPAEAPADEKPQS